MPTQSLETLQTELTDLQQKEKNLRTQLDELHSQEVEKKQTIQVIKENLPVVLEIIDINLDDRTITISSNTLDTSLQKQGIYNLNSYGLRKGIPITLQRYKELQKLEKKNDKLKIKWKDFKIYQKLKTLETKEQLKELQPHFTIDLQDNSFLVTRHDKGNTSELDFFQGAIKKFSKKEGVRWTIPCLESGRLEDHFIEKNKRCEQYDYPPIKIRWTKEAKKRLEDTKKQASEAKTIAEKKDSDIVVNLQNGNELMPFQKVGVEFLNKANGSALLCDQMGLGKTWEAIGYVEYNDLTAIIVCPAFLKENWRREIKKLTGEDAYICNGSTPQKYQILEIASKKYRYIIINYEIFGKGIKLEKEKGKEYRGDELRFLWADLLSHANYDIVIYDESHKIKNTNANRTKATLHLDIPRRLFMSGTPILNRPQELFSILRLLKPGEFTSEKRFKNTYTDGYGNARNVSSLRKSLSSLMIRRTKKEILTELPAINRIYDWYSLSDEGRERYEEALNGVYESLAEFDKSGVSRRLDITSILAKITRCKQIAAQDKVERIADLAIELNDSGEGEGEGKVIIFSAFKAVARAIGRRLGHEALVFDGDTHKDERVRLVDQFQTDKNVRFLVATGFVAGEGITLTKAGYIIFSDLGWTPAYHQQCEERVYGRLNDAHGAVSYYIVASKTIEEWVQQILDRKLKVIEEVVEGKTDHLGTDEGMGKELIKRLKEERG